MPAIRNITQVTLENLHEELPEYIHNNKIIIGDYNDMKDVYLRMLKDRYLFTIDRDTLVACLTDLTYMFCPGDDLNKDRVIELLEYGDDDSDDESDDGEEGITVEDLEDEEPPMEKKVTEINSGGISWSSTPPEEKTSIQNIVNNEPKWE